MSDLQSSISYNQFSCITKLPHSATQIEIILLFLFLPSQGRQQDKDTLKKEGLETLAIEMNWNANRSFSPGIIDLVVYIQYTDFSRSFLFLFIFFLKNYTVRGILIYSLKHTK